MGHRLGLLSMIDSWEMESLPKLTVRSSAAGLMPARYAEGTVGVGKESRLRRNARSSAWLVTFVVKREKACGGCLGTRRRGRPW